MGLQRLQLAHPLHRAQGEREDDQAGDEGDQDDPETPGDPDVVVQPDDQVRRRGPQLLDDGDRRRRNHCGSVFYVGSVVSVPRGAGGAGRARRSDRVGVPRKSRRSLSFVDAAVAERVAAQHPPAGEDRARGPDRAPGSPRPRRSSRSGSSGSAARWRVRSSAGRRGSGRAGLPSRSVSRQTLLPGLSHELRQRGSDPLLSLSLEQALDSGPGDHHVVVPVGDLVAEVPERLAGPPPSPCSGPPPRRSCGRPRARAASPLAAPPRSRGERVEDQRNRFRASCPRGRRDRSRRSARGGADGHRGGPAELNA